MYLAAVQLLPPICMIVEAKEQSTSVYYFTFSLLSKYMYIKIERRWRCRKV